MSGVGISELILLIVTCWQEQQEATRNVSNRNTRTIAGEITGLLVSNLATLLMAQDLPWGNIFLFKVLTVILSNVKFEKF